MRKSSFPPPFPLRLPIDRHSLALVPGQLDTEGDGQLGKLLHMIERKLFVSGRIPGRVDQLVRVGKSGF